MRKGIVVGSVLTAVLLLGAAACGGSGGGGAAPTPTKAATQAGSTPTKAPGGTATGEIVLVRQTEAPNLYRFIPDTYNLELGKAYTLSFEKSKEFHTFTVKDLTIKEAAGVDIFINVGETVQQTITPTKAGTFKLFCLPHEGLDMVGKVIVK